MANGMRNLHIVGGFTDPRHNLLQAAKRNVGLIIFGPGYLQLQQVLDLPNFKTAIRLLAELQFANMFQIRVESNPEYFTFRIV